MGVAQREQGHLDELVEQHVLAHQHELGVLLLAVELHGALVVLHHAEHGQHVAWGREEGAGRSSGSMRGSLHVTNGDLQYCECWGLIFCMNHIVMRLASVKGLRLSGSIVTGGGGGVGN